jgi:hypothetical protein
VTVSQTHGDIRDIEFDGRIQLNGESAPELEVIVELHDEFVVLGHSSGELGRWARNIVQVAPLGRGWFSLDVEDEQVTFLPRRPGHFAAATIDLLPVEEVKKKRFGRKAADKKEKKAKTPAPSRKQRAKQEKEAKVAAPSRKELRRRQRREAADAAATAVQPAPSVAEPTTPAPEPEPAPTPVEPAATPVEPAPTPVEPGSFWVEPGPPPEPEIRPPSAPAEPPAEPPAELASPWDDVSVPEVPGRKRRDKKPPRGTQDALPKAPPKKRSKSPKPSRQKTVKPAKQTRVVEPVGLPKKSAFRRASAGLRHGLKGFAYRISDELRQTGIVPFDRLPAAPARTRPNEDHEHVFVEHRLPGGLTRNVCHACGLVSIGESAEDD